MNDVLSISGHGHALSIVRGESGEYLIIRTMWEGKRCHQTIAGYNNFDQCMEFITGYYREIA